MNNTFVTSLALLLTAAMSVSASAGEDHEMEQGRSMQQVVANAQAEGLDVEQIVTQIVELVPELSHQLTQVLLVAESEKAVTIVEQIFQALPLDLSSERTRQIQQQVIKVAMNAAPTQAFALSGLASELGLGAQLALHAALITS